MAYAHRRRRSDLKEPGFETAPATRHTSGADAHDAVARPWFNRLLVSLHYHRIRVVDGAGGHVRTGTHGRSDGPTLYLGLHRNGAVDGFVYASALPRVTFLVSTQLHRGVVGRFVFPGIPVARRKDTARGMHGDNTAQLARCADLLAAGGSLFVLPEGTSELGHRHLPFQKGAARILHATLTRGVAPTVIPVGIHYEAPTEWQSDAELLVGPSFRPALPTGLTDAEAVRVLHEQITAALESVGVNAPDAATFAQWERIAYAATLGTGRSYARTLKVLEAGIPEIDAIAAAIETPSAHAPPPIVALDLARCARHQGVPLVPTSHAWAYVLLLIALCPIVLVASLLNLPPLLAAHLGARRLADAPNTLALWRILIGGPAFVGWACTVLAACVALGSPAAGIAYGVLTVLGLRSRYRVRKLWVSVRNLARGRALRAYLLTWHATLDRALTAHGA